MLELISTYTLGEFIGFCSILAGCIAAIVKFLSYLNEHFHFVETKKTKIDNLNSKLDSLLEKVEKNEDDTQVLKEASISRIKGKIVDRHKEYMALGYIDYRTLDYLQAQFRAYEKMGGNSYVHELMRDLEQLPLKD